MIINQVTNGGQRSPLRQRSPTQSKLYIQRQRSSGSPLRSLDPSKHNFSIGSEYMVEEKKGEELRRQIRAREAELQRMQQNQERLQHQISNTLIGLATSQIVLDSNHQTLNPLIYDKKKNNEVTSKIPLRIYDNSSQVNFKRYNDFNISTSTNNENNSLQSAQNQIIQQVDLTQPIFNQRLVNDYSTADQFSQKHHRNNTGQIYLKQLTNDNFNLLKRLTLVQNDLERVKNDCAKLEGKLNLVNQDNNIQQQVFEEKRLICLSDAEFQQHIIQQKQQNQDIQNKIKETDSITLQVVNSINMVQNQKGHTIMPEFNKMSYQYAQKLAQFKDLEYQKLLNQELINSLESQLSFLESSLREGQNRSHEAAQMIERLKREREEILVKSQKINESYDQARRVLPCENQQLIRNNKRHMQLLSSKAIYMTLERMLFLRKQSALNEFLNYCKFDWNCHKSLAKLASILQNIGHYNMKLCIQKWLSNTLQPLKTRKQSESCTVHFYKLKLKQKMFKIWRSQMGKAKEKDQDKSEAVWDIWRLKIKDLKQEVKRAFTIWRDYAKREDQRVRAIKMLILRQIQNKQRQALALWYYYNIECASIVRQHLLMTQFTENQLNLIALNQLKIRSKIHRTLRQRKLNLFLKAWKDSSQYRKLMMAQNVSVQHLKKQIMLRLISACFNQLRHHKETVKFQLMQQTLIKNYEPDIEQLQDKIESLATEALKQKRTRSLYKIAQQIRTQLFSYFNHWKDVQIGAELKISINLKQILLRRYRQQLHSAFNVWVSGHCFHKNIYQASIISQHTDEGVQINSEIGMIQRSVVEETQRQQKNQRGGFLRACRIYLNRIQSSAVQKWHQKVLHLKDREIKGVLVIMKKLRKIKCQQAFALYLQKIKMIKETEMYEKRCDYYLQTKVLRTKRQIFDAFCKFFNHFDKAKRNQQVLLRNLEIWLIRRSFKHWIAQGDLKTSQIKQESQNKNSLKFDQLNQDLSQVVQIHNTATQNNTELQNNLIIQAKRVLSNTFARFYYIKAERGIKKWCDYIKFIKHRENLIKRTAEHARVQQFYFMKAAFQNWIAQCKIIELQQQISYSTLKTTEVIQQNTFNRQTHEAVALNLQQQTQENVDFKNMLDSQRNQSIAIIVRKNKENYYQSKFRYMFYKWREFTKRQLSFIMTIHKIVIKSQWQMGFTNISAFARDKALTRLQNRAAEGMSRMHFKKVCGEAYHKWRSFLQNDTKQSTIELSMFRNVEIQKHQKFFNKVQDYNCKRCYDMVRRFKLANYLRGWKNVNQWIIQSKKKSSIHSDLISVIKTRISLKKWHSRARLTTKCKNRILTFKHKKRLLLIFSVFRSLKFRYLDTKNFCTVLSNLASKFDNNQKISVFQMIKGFGKSRLSTYQHEKQISALNFTSILHQIYLRRMTAHLSQLKSKILLFKAKVFKIKSMMGNCYSRGLRQSFQKWRVQTHSEAIVEQVNEQGPIVEQVLNEQLRYENSKNFLRDQSYTEPEINNITDWAKQKANELLQRSLARMQHYSTVQDLYLKPKIFDRWKMIVKMRKLLTYILRNMCNKLQPVKADLSIAFNRWKYDKRHLLCGHDKQDLIEMCEKNNRHKSQLNQLEEQALKFMNQMQVQRDDLVDTYMSSQRIAIAVGRDNLERNGLHRGLSILIDHTHMSKRLNFEHMLIDRINLINSLKERIQCVEDQNETLAVENEELRQFSLDGYQIAKNVKNLCDEREVLSVDLADKATTIQKLLDQNEQLQFGLKLAQEKAISLINKSNSNIRRLQAATGRY